MAAKKAAAKKAPAKTEVDVTAAETPGAVEVKIEPVESTVQGEEPTSHEDKDKEREKLTSVPVEEREAPVVSSVAQLRDAANSTGKTVSTEQVAEARKVEDEVLKEGGELHRPPAAERG